MKLLTKKEVREKTTWSPAHVDRLEAAGRFPKRVRLGPGRVAWVEAEIDAFLEELVAKRGS